MDETMIDAPGEEAAPIDLHDLRFTPDGAVDGILEHPAFGPIPFTVRADDVEAFGRELHARLVAGEFGEITGVL